MPRAKANPVTREPRELTDSEPVDEETITELVPMAIEVDPPMPQQHLIVGVGALAAMSDEAFEHNLAMLNKGQDRLEKLTKELLVLGTDYGKVPGIAKPFLQKPGAEKLGNFYGLAVRFEADRIIGDGTAAPQLAYHVRSYAHLGNFDGPVVAAGFGEANGWEERYRWRTGKPKCPNCGREGLVRGRKDGPLKGQWWCPGREGGCNSKFDPGDIPQVAREENTDPWSLANTLVKMAEKRAHVDVILRATGTSGYFSQDEDSPSVRQQSAERGGDTEEAPTVTVTAGPAIEVKPGATVSGPTEVQLRRLVTISKEKDLGAVGIAALIHRLFGLTVDETSAAVSTTVRTVLSGEQVGQLIMAAETGEIPSDDQPDDPDLVHGSMADHAAH